MKFNDANVVITGGASGIGRIMGRMALERGAARLIIWDINESNIELVKNELSGIGQVSGLCVDVSDSDIIENAYRSTVNMYGPVDILIQCAGIVTSNATFDRLTPRDIERTMMINAVAPMNVAHVMLADMIKRDKERDRLVRLGPHRTGQDEIKGALYHRSPLLHQHRHV